MSFQNDNYSTISESHDNEDFIQDLGWDDASNESIMTDDLKDELEKSKNNESDDDCLTDDEDESKEKQLSNFVMTDIILKNRKKSSISRDEEHNHLSTFIKYLKSIPIKKISKEESTDIVFHLFNNPIGLLLGKVPEDLLKIYHKTHADLDNTQCDQECPHCSRVDFRALFLDVTHVFNYDMKEVFSYLSNNERAEQCEMEFLEDTGIHVRFLPSIVSLLIESMDNYVQRSRSEWSATYVKTIHVLLSIFGNRRQQLAEIIGNDEDLFNQKIESLDDTCPYKDVATTFKGLLHGRGKFHSIFILETLMLMVCDLMRASKMRYPYLHQMITNAGYHQVRCAIDTLSEKILYVCLLSPSYFADAWLPYMRLYHPHICPKPKLQKNTKEEDEKEKDVEDVEDENKDYELIETAPPPTFYESIVFYYPSSEVAIVPDAVKMAECVEGIFHLYTSQEFKSRITFVSVPDDFPGRNIIRLFGIKQKQTRKRISSPVTPSSSSSSSSTNYSTSSKPKLSSKKPRRR